MSKNYSAFQKSKLKKYTLKTSDNKKFQFDTQEELEKFNQELAKEYLEKEKMEKPNKSWK